MRRNFDPSTVVTDISVSVVTENHEERVMISRKKGKTFL